MRGRTLWPTGPGARAGLRAPSPAPGRPRARGRRADSRQLTGATCMTDFGLHLESRAGHAFPPPSPPRLHATSQSGGRLPRLMSWLVSDGLRPASGLRIGPHSFVIRSHQQGSAWPGL